MRDLQKSKFDGLPEKYQARARDISKRVFEIDDLLKAGTKQAIKDAVLDISNQLRPQPETEAKDLVEGYLRACDGFPDWAISEAVNDYLSGQVENHTGQFIPTCAEFAKRVRLIVQPFQIERHGLEYEARRLIDRAKDEARRNQIERERRSPERQKRVESIMDKARKAIPKKTTPKTDWGTATPEQLAELEELKAKRKYRSVLQDKDFDA